MKDQIKVSEILADHFATFADGIGETDADLWDSDDFTYHPSVQLIEQKSTGCDKFDFQEVYPTQVKRALESLDANKAIGHDGVSAKIRRPELRKYLYHSLLSITSASKRVNGQVTGKKGTVHRSIKKRTRTLRIITDL